MKKQLIIVAIAIMLTSNAFSQSQNFRAQGKYYSAKESYEEGSYSSAINYIKSSKELLGGTNYLIQYLHIMSAYKAGKYTEAQKEMNRYYRILDDKEKAIGFKDEVEELTSDETRDITKLIDKIDYNVSNNTESKRIAEQKARVAAAEKASRARAAAAEKERFINDKLSYLESYVNGYKSYGKSTGIKWGQTYRRNGNTITLKITYNDYGYGGDTHKIGPKVRGSFTINILDIGTVLLSNPTDQGKYSDYAQIHFTSSSGQTGSFYAKNADYNRISSDLSSLKKYVRSN